MEQASKHTGAASAFRKLSRLVAAAVGDRYARVAAARLVEVERQVSMQTCRRCSAGFRLCSFPGLRRVSSSLLRKRRVSWSVLTNLAVDP